MGLHVLVPPWLHHPSEAQAQTRVLAIDKNLRRIPVATPGFRFLHHTIVERNTGLVRPFLGQGEVISLRNRLAKWDKPQWWIGVNIDINILYGFVLLLMINIISVNITDKCLHHPFRHSCPLMLAKKRPIWRWLGAALFMDMSMFHSALAMLHLQDGNMPYIFNLEEPIWFLLNIGVPLIHPIH